jgi:hypothetical protein
MSDITDKRYQHRKMNSAKTNKMVTTDVRGNDNFAKRAIVILRLNNLFFASFSASRCARRSLYIKNL